MERKTNEELIKLTKNELAKYIVDLDKELTKQVEDLTTENTFLKGENEKIKLASLKFVENSKPIVNQTRSEDDERFDLTDLFK